MGGFKLPSGFILTSAGVLSAERHDKTEKIEPKEPNSVFSQIRLGELLNAKLDFSRQILNFHPVMREKVIL